MPDNIAELVRQMTAGFEAFKAKYDDQHETLRNHVRRIEANMNRPSLGSSDDTLQNRPALNAALRAYARGDDMALKNMSIGSDPDGGYLIGEIFSPTMMARAFELSPFREFSRVIPISSTSWKEPADTDQPGASWVTESSSRPETTAPKVGMLEIVAQEQYSMPAVTQALLEDTAIDLAGWLGEKIGNKFFRDEAAAIAAGDGINKPHGILSYPIVSTADATRPWGSLQYIPTGGASDFIAPTTSASPADCLIDAVYAMKSTYRTGARWYMNRLTAGKVRKFRDPQGRFVWGDAIIAGQPPLLFGFPVVTAEDMPAVGTNTYQILFANLGFGYTIVDRVGISLLRDPYSQKPNVLFYTRRRVGGAVSNSEAIKVVKCATS